ncbi:hypothetical protein HNQ92_004517 [Rhabdobacter roseus]|uniref:Uncharacterized protein n=1 Tax=Rhabdobacter roseus TaxID=1655419 RepID=A0A840TXQ1_9BACT|nr:hypothetical protein [Rhabdobacter roseus]
MQLSTIQHGQSLRRARFKVPSNGVMLGYLSRV